MDLGPHAVFIVGAYLGALLAVIALIAYAAIDARRVRARLAALEAKGVRRRSADSPR
jgi:heme exporter protein D